MNKEMYILKMYTVYNSIQICKIHQDTLRKTTAVYSMHICKIHSVKHCSPLDSWDILPFRPTIFSGAKISIPCASPSFLWQPRGQSYHFAGRRH